ncbi:MAG: MarR family winged helix-turn-helix transcriptional regulator [Gemmatimonadales bacterium]
MARSATTTAAGDQAMELAELLVHATRRLHRGSMEHLGPLGLTVAQARVLHVLSDRGALRMADVAALLDVVPRTATSMVDGLEAAALVRRWPDPEDRRSVRVELTAAGRRLLDRLHVARRASAEQVFGTLTSAERRQFVALLEQLCERGGCSVCGHGNGAL